MSCCQPVGWIQPREPSTWTVAFSLKTRGDSQMAVNSKCWRLTSSGMEVQLEAHPCLFMHGICCFFFVVTTPSAKSAKDCYMTETAHVAGEEQKSLVSVGSSSVGEKGKVWVVVEKGEWWLRSIGTRFKQVNVGISLSLTTITKHYLKKKKSVFTFSAARLIEKV